MIAKTFEIRDAGTFIPMLAVKLNPGCEADRYLLARAGYGRSPDDQATYVLLCQINGGGGKCYSDIYDWGGPATTYPVAHDYIIKNFDILESGSVICTETIRGLRSTPKTSERFEAPL